jgi:hypothetical protein
VKIDQRGFRGSTGKPGNRTWNLLDLGTREPL